MVYLVPLDSDAVDRFEAVIGGARTDELRTVLRELAGGVAGRVLWHVNSTAAGGGVAEMLPVLLAYLRGAGLDTRWAVVGGDATFFAITKRLHNFLHGSPGDGGDLGRDDRAHYRAVTGENATALRHHVRVGDIVVLHDPQTAGLVAPLKQAGATVIWRCHVGADRPDDLVARGWAFLQPLLEEADAFVFSRREHVHDWMPDERVTIVAPSIDPFAAKNQPLEPDAVRAILDRLGLVGGVRGGEPGFLRRDGSHDVVQRPAEVVRGGTAPDVDAPLVVQVSRWDRLKDMAGVMRAFAAGVDHGAHLVLAGPSVAGVSDDPEGAEVLAECAALWDALPAAVQARIRLVCLPMADRDENAAMVNALQRHAAVVVQKSLAEGFGLTVTEAMWKARPVVASAVGGIQDQIRNGHDGVLLADPSDLDALGTAVVDLLADAAHAGRLGTSARERVIERFLGNRHLLEYARLYARLASQPG